MAKNYGFIEPTIEPEAWLVLGATGADVRPDGIWKTPLYEPQAENFETFGCTVWGLQNQIEMYLMEVFGYEPNYDERYNYNIVEINPPGADPQKAYESAREKGLTTGALPMTATLEEFKTPRPMTSSYIKIGKEWNNKYKLNHWWMTDTSMSSIIAMLNKCPVGVSVTAWSEQDGVYVDNGQSNTHWCVAFAPTTYQGRPTIKVFDSYDHSIKTLHPDHKISVAKRILITVNDDQERISTLQAILVWAKEMLLKMLDTLRAMPETLETPEPKTKQELLLQLAKDSIGIDVSTNNLAPSELSCAEGVAELVNKITPFPTTIIATTQLKEVLDDNKFLERTLIPEPGCIIVSPRTANTFGHAGIFLTHKRIASNDSKTGLWQDNYSFDSWIKEMKDSRGLRIYLWRFRS